MQELLTRFNRDDPCWTEELLQMAGEDVSLLPGLVGAGLLHLEDDRYSLTEAGAAAYGQAKQELFLDGEAGRASGDPGADVFRTALRIYLDAAHVQRWGIKDFKIRQSLPFLPAVAPDELVSLRPEGLEWKYADDPVYKKMARDFPAATIDARRTDCVPQEKIAAWAKENGAAYGTLDVDLLYLCRYDFMQYKDFAGHPNDPLRLINTDRFLFVIPDASTEKNLETVGKFHLWLNHLRRMQIPGYVDRDTQEQDSVSWLVFATKSESEAKTLAQTLKLYGEDLVKNANPCEIWTISLEALKSVGQKRELVWELLPDIAHPVQRTLL